MSHGLGFCHENNRTGPVKGLNGMGLRLIIVNKLRVSSSEWRANAVKRVARYFFRHNV